MADPTVPGADVTRPTDLLQARDVMREGHERGAGLLICGGTTKLDWGRPPQGVERIIDTTGLDRLIEHDPGDMTAVVGAGMPLGQLQDRLATAGQWLAIDPPRNAPVDLLRVLPTTVSTRAPSLPSLSGQSSPDQAERTATVGGIFASNDSGPRRLRYGSLRELVIGMTVVLPDGTVARSGSKVIKNVAGYDLCKLYSGSLGTLGLVVELIVRLHPLPDTSRTVRVPAASNSATALVLALMASPLEPTAVEYNGDELFIRFDGSDVHTSEQSKRTLDLVASHQLDCALIPDEQQAALWEELGQAHAGGDGKSTLRIAALPSRLHAVTSMIRQVAEQARVDVALASHACLGLHTARLAGGGAAQHAALIERARARMGEIGGHVVVRSKISGLDELVDPFGPPPPSLSIMRRVKQRLDGKSRCARGRFIGGL
ncbi:MAG: FAD-binding oxidoreductase [Proteobacteria bacterium]|nr:FAD-binding oxidoreductase [Pseudomonadota bacterium]